MAKKDFSQKGAIYLRPEAQFDCLVALSDAEDRAQAIITAMASIEEDYESLKGALPNNEYQELSINTLPGGEVADSIVYDISKNDFERLKKEFERSGSKRTTVQNLKQVIDDR